MVFKHADKKLAGTVVGWAAAAACLAAGIFYINSICSRNLSLMLFVNGEEICCVENRAVVDEALLMLDEKLEADGIVYSDEREISYKYVTSDSSVPANAYECMDLLYEVSAGNYSRAYIISVQENDIAVCATYAEAEKVVSEFEKYIVEYVMETTDDADAVELTTEFEIRNAFCVKDKISSADEICRLLLDGAAVEETYDTEGVADTRVTATGNSFLLSPDRYMSFGLVKNEAADIRYENSFSFTINGLQSAIEYKTVVTEKYSEIISCETEYIESDELYIGETLVVSEGEDGIAENEYEVSYADGVEISRELVSSVIISSPKNRVELIGTKAYPSTEPTGAFMWPILGKFVITSPYGISREEFDNGSYHYGIDIAGVSMGDPVYAADGGTVTFAGTQGTYGLLVKIRHEDGVETYYAHMRSIDVKVGDKVYKGQKIAEIGMTGVTTGPHLHFEVRIDGKTVNPVNYLPKR